MKVKTSIIMHGADGEGADLSAVRESLDSVLALKDTDYDICILGAEHSEIRHSAENAGKKIQFTGPDEKELAAALNKALSLSDSENVLYMENGNDPVLLKKACLQAFNMSAQRLPDAGYFYSDYDVIEDDKEREINLLFHHIGRVRDNQDYGRVHFFRREALENMGGFDENVKYNNMYDTRLRISEKYDLIRIANKYNGSLYKVKAAGKKTNVFDYLIAGKDVQLEAEHVVTEHLKRIGAYLAPGDFKKSGKKVADRSELAATVIIPVGFRPEFIGTAIGSIQAQTVQNIEAVIVVNGGENDPTAAEVRRYMSGGDKFDPAKPEIRLIVIDINSIGLCLNLGAQAARGKYYVQLDSDDRLKKDAVEKTLKVFETEDNVGMVIGSYEVWKKKNDGSLSRMEEIPVVTHGEWTDDNGRNNLLRINGAGAPRCIPISVIEEMGWFSINDDAYARNYGEDYEMVNKIAEHYRIGRIYDPIYEVIRHSGGTDHAISQDVVDRNDEAKDDMRLHAIKRRIAFNSK